MPGGLYLGQLVSRRRRARGANQPIRLFQNVGIFRLFSRKKAEHHERHAKYQAYHHNFPIGASVCTVKRTRHKSPLAQHGSPRILAGDHFRTASQRLGNGFVGPQTSPSYFNAGHCMGRPTQTVPWDLLLLAAAHFLRDSRAAESHSAMQRSPRCYGLLYSTQKLRVLRCGPAWPVAHHLNDNFSPAEPSQ